MSDILNDGAVIQTAQNVELAIGVEDGKVKLKFPRPMEEIALDRGNAAEIGQCLMLCAHELGLRIELPAAPRKPITPTARLILVNRFKVVIKSLTEQKRNMDYISQQLVDIVLSEIDK